MELSAETPETSQNSNDKYIEILQASTIPKDPSEMPDQISIPKEIIGDLPQASTDTKNDNEAKERLQATYVKRGKLVTTEITVGKPKKNYEVGVNAKAEGKIFRNAFFLNTALFVYHTHPSPNPPGNDDIVTNRAFRRSAYIDATVAEDKVIVFAQTEKSLRLPLSMVVESYKAKKKLHTFQEKQRVSFFTDKQPLDDSLKSEAIDKLTFLEDEGIAVYIQRFSDQNELRDGLKLERVTSDMIHKSQDIIL